MHVMLWINDHVRHKHNVLNYHIILEVHSDSTVWNNVNSNVNTSVCTIFHIEKYELMQDKMPNE